MSEKMCQLINQLGNASGSDMTCTLKASPTYVNTESEPVEHSYNFTMTKDGKLIVCMFTGCSDGSAPSYTTYYVKINNTALTPTNKYEGNVTFKAVYIANYKIGDTINVYLKNATHGISNAFALFVLTVE